MDKTLETEAWEAEWAKKPALQAEYPTAAAYAAIMRRGGPSAGAAKAGAVPAANHQPSTFSPQVVERWNAEWAASAALQAEYPTAAGYVATMKRAAR